MRTLRNKSFSSRVRILSFDWRALAHVQKMAPDILKALIGEHWSPVDDFVRLNGISCMFCHWLLVAGFWSLVCDQCCTRHNCFYTVIIDTGYAILDDILKVQLAPILIEYPASSIEYQMIPSTNSQRPGTSSRKPETSNQLPV